MSRTKPRVRRVRAREVAQHRSRSSSSHSAGLASSPAIPAWQLAALYFFSGIPALLYQTVWQRLLVLHSGVGATSVAIIVAATMLGLGLGSWLGGYLSRQRTRRQSLLIFASLELMVAVFAYLSPHLLVEVLYKQYGAWYENLWAAAVLHMATLVIPTTLMGMTLPLLTSAVAQLDSGAPRNISILYGSNALGAALGALMTPWILMPYVGVPGVCSVGATINFLVAVVAFKLALKPVIETRHSMADRIAEDSLASQASQASVDARLPFPIWTAIYFLSGFLAIGLEIFWFRLLDVSVKSSSYTFGTLLGVYLACMALGSLIGARRAALMTNPLTAYFRSQTLVIVGALLPIVLVMSIPETLLSQTWLFQYWADPFPLHPGRAGLGAVAMLYIALPLAIMAPSTLAMGYGFVALQRGVHADARNAGFRVGILQAFNILGCVLGSLIIGLWCLGSIGTPGTLMCLAAVGTVFAFLGFCWTRQRLQFACGLVTILLLAWCVPEGDAFWRRFHGELSNSQMVMAEDISGIAVAAPEKSEPQWRVSTNGKSQSHIPFGGFHAKLGALPVALHPNPETIAIIGLGSGNTAWAASCRSSSKSITVFEVCTAEKPLLDSLAASGNHQQLRDFLNDPRVHIVGRDARHALMMTDKRYDIIETDAIRPYSAYAGYLYSIEFFELCRSRLKAGGLMCCWSPTPATHSTFRQAFPHVLTLDDGYVLIGSSEPIDLDKSRWTSVMRTEEVAGYLGLSIIRECVKSIESATDKAPVEPLPIINTDLLPFDEFH